MKERQHKYIPGDHLLICDECGLTYRRSQMSQRWDKAWVCLKDFERKHPQEYVRANMDKIRVGVVRGDSDIIAVPSWALLLRNEDGSAFLSESGEKQYQEGE